MEASSSCSSPLSVHSFIDFLPSSLSRSKNRSVSAKFGTSRDFHGRRKLIASCSSSSSSSSSYFGFSIQPKRSVDAIFKSNRKRRSLIVSAVFERFTERAIKAVMFSQKEARVLGKDMVFTQHLLLGLIAENRDPDGFLGSGINIDMARDAVRSIWHEEGVDDQNQVAKTASATDVPFSVSTKRVFDAAVEYSRTMGYNFIAPEHIAIGLFTVDDGNAGRVLKKLGVNTNYLAAVAISRLQGELVKDGRELPSSQKKKDEKLSSGKIIIDRSSESRDKSSLSEFCADLTARARDGMIDPVIGRELEVQRIIQILCRRTKNNPILLGVAGVGKTAIAEGLAISISQGDVPVFLQGKRIMSLDVGLLIAGAKERGELESRVTTLIKDIKKAGNVILFIDEVHTLVGSGTVGRGNKGSGLDISNLLKPSLGRGELQCVASTTLDEYRSHFEKDKALARRFQPVYINEPSEEDAVRILLGVRTKYESHHKCRYTLEAINAAVQLSARYIPDRHLPDKAIDLIDEAGSKVRMDAYKRKKEQQIDILSKSPTDYWQEINSVKTLHDIAISRKLNENDGAIELPDSYLPYTPSDEGPLVVGPAEIAAVASLWSGIPVQQLTLDEMKMLVGLDEQLKKRVIGQGEAVDAICRAVKRSRVGLKDPDRPIAAMLFCGPTGVGKTELTKALAASYFGSEAAMLRLDMSEYMERHTVSKLIGSPPGYVGYGEGGTLTEAIRRQPFTVVLLDEIEKAHPDIFNILLQLFEDGHLTDSQGRRVSFKNALVVMTSNVGSAAIAKGRHKSIGFMLENDESTSYSGMKALLIEELKNYFRPELLNRIDEIVVFRPLEQNQVCHPSP
ncbi:chaperone protein ClpD, chloroplastic isoform X2 [Impatiens glandulifera]|uniref:chaperone protein ClpD, chloroplastic isoform X2 n=1 Tax=Impatiens glandulifera TaxID=253017 RepID=UPI001FB091E4|nr:chaperone protein ClpD, chloroplastic isoform X2 [Impatiens glandulifera]